MIVIDPSKGGRESGVTGNGIVEKDYNLLISEYIFNRLKSLGADVKIIRTTDEYISEDDRANKILNAYGNNSKVVALSNMLGNTGSGAEIIYALRNNSNLASALAENLDDAGLTVSKYYQRRSENDTSKDYYNIQKDTGLIETIIVNYGNINNINEATNIKNEWEDYAEAVVKSLANYTNVPYYKEGESQEIYTVKKGDSLWKIANKYNTTVEKLKSANNLKTNTLSVGQKLVIPSISVSPEVSDTYIVQKGDSLWSIANKFNMTVSELKNLNNLTNNLLSIGQVLKIKDSSNNGKTTYTVQKGDSLWVIANKYGITTEELKSYNNLTSNLLSIGQVLKIPQGKTSTENIYTVKKGDSLWTIANRYNTTVEKIKVLNNLTSNLLSIGQQLKIPN
ncbi:MAG: LysM peptidoglycan-binding domain-containing protein [Bacilli bacterium]|nr:LysM peptidoglycan-binding domain-containing protein [Bacilli bacterium]